MDAKQAHDAIKNARAVVCAVPLMKVPQPVPDRARFVREIAKDQSWATMRALMEMLSCEGGLAGIPSGVNKYVDRYRAERAAERDAA